VGMLNIADARNDDLSTVLPETAVTGAGDGAGVQPVGDYAGASTELVVGASSNLKSVPVQSSPDKADTTGATILLAAEHRPVRGQWVRLLTEAGYCAILAENLPQALHMARTRTVDLLVLDGALPGAAQSTLCGQFRANEATRGIPILQLCVNPSSREPHGPAPETGADACLAQPVHSREFLALVRTLLRLRRAEQARRASDERFRTFADHLSQLAWVADLSGRMLWFNRSWFDFTGAPLEAMAGTGWTSTIHPEHTDRVLGKMREHFQAGEVWEDTFPLQNHEGGFRWFLSRAKPIRDERGEVVSWFGTSTDITELRETRSRLALAEAMGRLGVFDWDLVSGRVAWTSQLEKVMGLPEGTFEGSYQAWAKRVDPADLVRLEALLDTWLATKQREVTFDFRARRADGEWRWIEASAVIDYSPAGQPVRMIGINADVTERKENELVVRRSESQLRELTDAIPLMIWFAAADGSNQYVNRRWFEYTGQTAEEAHGTGWMKVVHPEDQDRVVASWKQFRQTGTDTELELRFRGVDGSYRWFLDRAVAVRNEHGEITRWFGSATDISDIVASREAQARKQEDLENLVADRTAQLRNTIAELEHFSYTITHDLRASLRATQAFSQILDKDHAAHLTDEGRNLLHRILEASRQADSLITNAIDYRKMVRAELELQPIDPAALLRGIIGSLPQLQPPLAEIQVAPDLPLVLGHRAGLTQCCSNLLLNAIKFVKPGIIPQVRIHGERHGDWARLWFEDNGIGIPPEDRERVFEMFCRLSGSYEGTGIGLPLVRKAIQRMKGRVGIESATGGGTRFWIDLQAAAPPSH